VDGDENYRAKTYDLSANVRYLPTVAQHHRGTHQHPTVRYDKTQVGLRKCLPAVGTGSLPQPMPSHKLHACLVGVGRTSIAGIAGCHRNRGDNGEMCSCHHEPAITISGG